MVKQFTWTMRERWCQMMSLSWLWAAWLQRQHDHGFWAVCHVRDSSPQEIFVNNKDPGRIWLKKARQLWPSTFPGKSTMLPGREPGRDSKAAAGEKKQVFAQSLASGFAAVGWIVLGSWEDTIHWLTYVINREIMP